MIHFNPPNFPEIYIFKNDRHADFRGYFQEWTNCASKELFPNFNVQQINIVNSRHGVIRGLHSNRPGNELQKLITCISGSINDVVVDVRKGSKTFGKHFTYNLNHENGYSILIPNGFGHGYSVLSENATVLYQVSSCYDPQSEIQINPLDQFLEIEWGLLSRPILSKQDAESRNLNEIVELN